MNEFALASGRAPELAPDLSQFPARARWALALLSRAQHGALAVDFPDGQRGRFGAGAQAAHVRLANWNVFDATLKSGDIGFAESYLAGDWSTPDLARLLRFLVRNRAAAEQLIYGSFLGNLAYRLRHLLRSNRRAQAQRNIVAHYDLGNSFYSLWLDPTLTYSSGLFADRCDVSAPFEAPSLAELEAAQESKYARVLEQLQLKAGARLLEIGCGWGGLAVRAARTGLQVTGLTLSPLQLEFARARLADEGLGADLRLQDYRDERGCYDGVASIEMLEAVGEAYWPRYFATLARVLEPGARACIQTIEIRDNLFARYRRGSDFIQQYIFPGGMLPCPRALARQAERAGLRIINRHPFGGDYARTLATWRTRFLAQIAAVRALGFDQRFIRLWEFYLAYCEAAFAQGDTDVTQYTLVQR